MKRPIEVIAGRLVAAQRQTAAFFMIAMTGLYGFNVMARTFVPQLSGSLAWIDDAARYLMIWVVFLAVGPALDSGRHIVVDLAWRHLGAAKGLIFRLIDVTGFLFSALMTVLSVQLTMFIAQTGQVSPTLELPAYILYIAPIIGFASLAMIFLLRVFGFCDAQRNRSDPEQTG
jgi:TRAP-type C4-dicarboxylate transport system permease small subunit